MMKIISVKFVLFGVISGLFLSCGYGKKESNNDTLTNSKIKAKCDLNGTWELTNYFDSIIKNKEIAKFRNHPPSWFAILLNFKGDTLTSLGSFNTYNLEVDCRNDTLVIFDDFGKWALIRSDDNLILSNTETFSNRPLDSAIYKYKKQKSLGDKVNALGSWRALDPIMTNYFNQNLISGTYSNSKQKIEFTSDGKIIGNLGGYKRYNVRNYFGTFHPFKDLDVVEFLNDSNQVEAFWNWRFDKNKLILTEFISTKDTDDYVLGNKKIILNKTKI